MVSTAILNLMKDSFTLIALLSLMFYQNWRLALFAIIMMPLSAALARTLGKRIGKATKESGVLAEDLTSFLSEIIRSSQMIRIFQTEKRENLNALNKTDAVIDKSIKIQSILIRATPIMEILTGIMIAGFIFFSGVFSLVFFFMVSLYFFRIVFIFSSTASVWFSSYLIMTSEIAIFS